MVYFVVRCEGREVNRTIERPNAERSARLLSRQYPTRTYSVGRDRRPGVLAVFRVGELVYPRLVHEDR